MNLRKGEKHTEPSIICTEVKGGAIEAHDPSVTPEILRKATEINAILQGDIKETIAFVMKYPKASVS